MPPSPDADAAALPAADARLPAAASMSVSASSASKRKLGVVFWIAVAWICLVVVMAVFAGLLPIDGPYNLSYLSKLGSSFSHPFGTDELGRDLFSRVIFGSRVSLEVGFGSIFLGLLVGGFAGLIAGYMRGIFDAVTSAVANVILSFPALLLLITVAAFWGRAWWKITLIIAIIATAPLFYVVRSSTISFAGRDFVLAARTMGASRWRIVTREILPNVMPAAISFGLIGVAIAIVAEGTLSFLGLSVAAPTPSWGNIIAEGQSSTAASDPWIWIWPTLIMFMTLLALNIAGDRLQRFFDVREGRL
ncbi:MAG: ABC transporter permease [Actinomycetota bacterium]|nr:ABC transporter permease [Actinomycetota bacterium]